jgi:hypothetical protein
MPYDVIIPKGSAPPLAPYSPGTKAGSAVYVSGTLALDSAGNLVGKGDVKAQTRHVLETIKSVLETAGGSMRGHHLQSYLPCQHGGLCRHERGLSRIFSRAATGALLHPGRSGAPGISGRDRVGRASEVARIALLRDPGNPAFRCAQCGLRGSCCCSTVTGSVNRKVEPWPGADSTQIFPPCISMMRLEIASPSPVPPFLRVTELSAC